MSRKLTPKTFVETQLYKSRKDYLRFKTLFVVVSVLSLLLILFAAVLTTLMFSGEVKAIRNSDGSIPVWFFIATTSATAGTGFMGSLLAFFSLQTKYKEAKVIEVFIVGEIIKFSESEGVYKDLSDNEKEYMIFARLSRKLGNDMEVLDEK